MAAGKAPAASAVSAQLEASDPSDNKQGNKGKGSPADACSDWDKGPQTAPYFSSDED